MNRKDFIKKVSEKSGLTQKDAREVVPAIFDVIMDVLREGDEICPAQGIRFTTHHMAGRTGRNPSTGEPMPIAPRNIPKVKFSKTIKDTFL